MAWFFLIVLFCVCVFWLFSGLSNGLDTQTGQTDINEHAYAKEIERLNTLISEAKNNGQPDTMLLDEKQKLEKKLLGALDAQAPDTRPLNKGLVGVTAAAVLLGAGGLYFHLGTPVPPASQTMAETPTPSDADLPPINNLVQQLEEKLKGERANDPQGWMLYARTLMNLGRYDEAFTAYEKALALTDNNTAIQQELEKARDFAVQQNNSDAQRGPSAEEVEAAQSMSPRERQAMIENMVTGLAERLREEPENPQGWIRLLRSRAVLGQDSREDVDFMKSVYADRPEMIEQILAESAAN